MVLESAVRTFCATDLLNEKSIIFKTWRFKLYMGKTTSVIPLHW